MLLGTLSIPIVRLNLRVEPHPLLPDRQGPDRVAWLLGPME